jgi:glycosyltransferase involved in cell wall biosynthesis
MSVAVADGTRTDRPPVAFLAWTDRTERADEIAGSLGGVARRFDGNGLRGRATAPLRYALNTAGTVWFLARVRPRAVITQNPPVFLGIIAWLYGLVARTPILLDSHPASFGRKGAGIWKLLLPIHRFLAVRAGLVLVTAHELAEEVRAWGGVAAEVHEAPTGALVATPCPLLVERPRVFYVGVFAPDEPIEALLEAARRTPDVDVHVTGDVKRAPAGLVDGAPENVTFVGFLAQDAYRQGLRDAHVVMALTTESTSVVRSGYEAVYAGRPLITSDWPVLRETFPYAVHAAEQPEELASALAAIRSRYDDLRSSTDAALAHQQTTWASQRAAIEEAIRS